MKDAEWIADLLQHDLLKTSYIPDKARRELRELVSYRKSLVGERSRELNRLQKMLEGTNIKLSGTVSDINGKSARRILEYILTGESLDGTKYDEMYEKNIISHKLKASKEQIIPAEETNGNLGWQPEGGEIIGMETVNEYLSDTIAAVFPSVATVDVRGYTNRELFAVKEGDVAARFDAGIDYIRKNGVSTGSTDEEFIALMAAVRDGMQEYEGGQHIFTDDRAPVELLGMREIDGMIRDEVGYYRSVYERDGIDGVLGEIL